MAKLDVTYAYAADIVKSERDPETGDLMVYGKATGPDLDLDEQICDPTWLKTAMPAWFEWGNIREQHGMVAAGVGTQLDQVGDDWWVTARIVDEGAAKKVEAGVYKGYSIGIKNARVIKDAKARGGRIVGGEIVENSLVDRPCNPTAKMSICKAAGLSEDGASIEVEDGADAPLMPVEVEPVAVERIEATADSAYAKVIGADLLRRLRAVVPEVVDISKAASDDIATAQQAIAVIAGLIQSEAAGLAAGVMCEAEQISCLLRAVDALCWFQCMESNEPPAAAGAGEDANQTGGSDYDMNGSVMTMAVKADGVAIDAATIKAAGEDASPAAETQDLVKAAVAEAMKAHEAELQTLRAELAKVNARPVPGGPVLARPRAVIAEAGEREQTLAEVEKFAALARTYRQIDPAFARDCDEKVKGLRLATKD